MKKYRQLILVLITLASLSTLLVYRHEYLKLRYVLEVLNFFGSSQGNINDCLVLNETMIKNYKTSLMFNNPSAAWLKLGSHFVYSAFWEQKDEKKYVRTLAVGPPSAFTDIECHIWFNGGNILYSEMGKFGYAVQNIQKSNSNDESKLMIFELFCELIEGTVVGRPHGVIFVQKKYKSKHKTFVPIYSSKPESNSRNKSAVCVKADVTGISTSNIIEFISYHLVIGITDFIIYDNGIHYNTITTLLMLQKDYEFGRTLSSLSWNFPFEDIDLQNVLMEMDCLARTRGKVEIVTLLDWDEYIVPKTFNSVYKMIQNAKPPEEHLTEYEFSSVVCCTDIKDDRSSDKSWPIALRKTQCMSLQNKIKLFVNPGKTDVTKQEFSDDRGAIYIYRYCKDIKRTITKYDPVVAQFLGGLMTSKLLRLKKSGMFLTDS